MSKLQKKPLALKRGHPTLKTWTFTIFFSTFVGHFCPPGFGSNPDPDPQPWLQIHDILVRIQIRESMPLTNGSGSCYFRHWPSRRQQKLICFKRFISLVLFEGTFRSFFKDKNSVVDPEWFISDPIPDPAFQRVTDPIPDPDPDPDPTPDPDPV